MRQLQSIFLSLLFLVILVPQVHAQNDALMHRYKFDGDLTDAVADSDGVYYDGAGQEVKYIEGHDGTANGAIDFAMPMGYAIKVGTYAPTQEGEMGQMTVTFWAKWHGEAGDFEDIINKRDDWDAAEMMWGINQHKYFGGELSIRQPDGFDSEDQNTGLQLPQEEWIHVAVGVDGFGSATFWLNGGEETATIPFEPGTGTHAGVYMGSAANPDGTWREGDAYNGALDDVRFYSRLLTDEEIQAVYDGSDITAVEDEQSSVPAAFQLGQNYPNPFNPATNIEYRLDQSAHVQLGVFNMAGQEVATLVDGPKAAGHYRVKWTPTADLSTGIYLYRLRADDFVATKKMVFTK